MGVNAAITGRLSPEELRDLGFGSIVSRESHQRLLNRDGSFNVTRKGLSFWTSLNLYHALLTIGWVRFFALVTLLYLSTNAVFAFAYLLAGPDALSSASPGMEQHLFLRAFFFSVQTLSTIGYGHITPAGLAANVVVTVESLIGLMGFAVVTGLLFARFSRPTAKILFSRQAVVAPYCNIQAFEFRVINTRTNQIIELEAKVILSRFENVNGVRSRRYQPLPLERDKVVFFPLSWTIVHPIDQESPLYGETADSLRQSQAEFLVLLTGFDETFSETVHTRSSYVAEEVVWEAKFSNLYIHASGERRVTVDMRRFHTIEPTRASAARPPAPKAGTAVKTGGEAGRDEEKPAPQPTCPEGPSSLG